MENGGFRTNMHFMSFSHRCLTDLACNALRVQVQFGVRCMHIHNTLEAPWFCSVAYTTYIGGMAAHSDEEVEELTLTDERVVRLGKFLWVPEQKNEEGICWFHMQKWDKKLVRFMTGKCMDLRSNKAGGSLDNDFYKDILLRRQQAFDKALAERMQELSDDEARADEPAAKKRKGKVKVKAVRCNPAKHKEYSPHHLAVKFQSLEAMGAEPEIKVLFEGLGTTSIWFELTMDVLAYLRAGFEKSTPKERQAKHRRS